MKYAKHRLTVIFLLMLSLLLSGCAKNTPEMPEEADVFSVYASFYPFYALTDMITAGADGVELHCLVQPQDGCLRSYSLSDWDLALLSGSADAVIAGGYGLESFEALLYALGEQGPAVSAVLHEMELDNRRAVNTSEDVDSHWLQGNPHIYMDVNAAQEISRRIAASLSLLNPANEAIYERNLQAATERLNALQSELNSALSGVQGADVIIMNEALVYAERCYGLNAALCYERESGEDLHGRDLENCLAALSKSEARVILLEKQAPQSLCRALEAAGYRVARLDVLSTRRAAEGAEGYFQAHRENAQAIINAFSQSE